uniref:ATP synthase complex subunit 8 n=1 Tax=Synapturanus sp. MZUSP 159215 TaxID=2877832 RepID=A0A8K1H5S0_9NEOB|nr:ATP synthase F0 subunit 8 [Synapturanus sp. MZUSP 159215]
MPQLIPDPWFFIFLFCWLTLLLPTKKILQHSTPNTLSQPLSKTTHKNWIWPWL